MALTVTHVNDIGTQAWSYEYTGTAPFELQEKGKIILTTHGLCGHEYTVLSTAMQKPIDFLVQIPGSFQS